MKKPEKILLIIFLLFFIYYLTIKIYSLKFREGRKNKGLKKSTVGSKKKSTLGSEKSTYGSGYRGSGYRRGIITGTSENEKLTAEEKEKAEAALAQAKAQGEVAAKAMKDKAELKAECTDTSLGKYERYKLAKKGILKCDIDCKKKEQKKTCKSNDQNNIDKTTCETSACTRAYKGAMMTPFFPVLPSINDVNVWDETQNPCMAIDFCKKCKKCYDAKTPTVTLDGTEFSCVECKIPENPEATNTDTDEKSWWSRCGF